MDIGVGETVAGAGDLSRPPIKSFTFCMTSANRDSSRSTFLGNDPPFRPEKLDSVEYPFPYKLVDMHAVEFLQLVSADEKNFMTEKCVYLTGRYHPDRHTLDSTCQAWSLVCSPHEVDCQDTPPSRT